MPCAQFLWNLFDPRQSGSVDSDEFVMAMALLSTGIGDSVEAQLEAAFCMFDTRKAGELTMDEFEAMVQATVNLNLDHLLVALVLVVKAVMVLREHGATVLRQVLVVVVQ